MNAYNLEPIRTITYEREHSQSLLQQQNEKLQNTVDILQESLAEIQLAIDAQGWTKNGGSLDEWDFTPEHVKKARAFARLMYIQNPMVKRSVEVQKLYVWALGFKIETKSEEIDTVLNAFVNDPKNACELSATALMEKEVDLQVNGDIFWAYFINRETGRVRVRTIDVDRIVDVYRNPLDSKEVWFYKEQYVLNNKTHIVWHPDWEYHPIKNERADPTEGRKDERIEWNVPMSQIKVGGFSNMKFGFPEIHSMLAWALAYKKFLENWATLMESYAVVAMQIIRQSKTGVAASKDKLSSKPGAFGVIGDSNPPAGVGSWASVSGNVELKAVRTAGATTDADEGHPLAKMIAAGAGLPITFYGDADVGNMATAATLDRPTELKFVFRQKQWSEWLVKLYRYVLLQSAIAKGGLLRTQGVNVVIERDDTSFTYQLTYPSNIDPSVGISFPDITEPNATERVRAIVMAVTMMGKPITSIFPNVRDVALLVARALGLKNPEALVEMWYPPGVSLPDIQDINPEPTTGLAAGGEEE